jgi:hypothetical protein
MALPHFLCIGAQKAGTSWLFEKLMSHPAVWMPPIKELHFFDHLFVERNRRWTNWHIQGSVRRAIKWHADKAQDVDLEYVRYLVRLATEDLFTERWYRAAFERPGAVGKAIGEITPEYSTVPPQGVTYVRSLLGAVRIVYIIRDPVERALSQIRMLAMRRGARRMNEEGWLSLANEPDIENRGLYSQYVPQWKAVFGGADLCFIPYGRLGAEPLDVLREVERFIGVGKHEYEGLGKRVHATEPLKIPESVIEQLRQRLSEQTKFIEAEFGKAFAASI